MTRVTGNRHRKHLDPSIRIYSPQLFFEQHRKRQPVTIVIVWPLRPDGRNAIAKRHRIAETHNPKCSGRLCTDRIISTKALGVCREHREIPNRVVEVWFQDARAVGDRLRRLPTAARSPPASSVAKSRQTTRDFQLAETPGELSVQSKAAAEERRRR